MNKKLKPVEAAKKFVEIHFPNCQGALLAGSVVRGQETETSDLDIIIFDKNIINAFRESFIDFGWPIELFAHNYTSYKDYFKDDRDRARPSLPRMVFEGIVLVDDGIIESIKKEARELLENGPEKWSEETIKMKRYFITDVLDDFIGSSNRAEELFIVSMLADLASEFVLRTNGQWIGSSKWVFRSLKNYDEKFAKQFVEAFDIYYKTGDKQCVIQIVDFILQPYGGRLFEGFSLGK